MEVTSRGGIEKVYYFRKEEPSVSAADSASRFVDESGAPQALLDGARAIQCLDVADLDYGYLIIVDLRSEKLNGVLTIYLECQRCHRGRIICLEISHEGAENINGALDPSRPKPNKSGYNFFFGEHYGRLKPLHQGQERAISKRIGILWSILPEAEKQQRGLRDKKRCQTEMQDYKASQL